MALTPEAFDKLLARLDADRETASIKYELLREKLIRFFERRDCREPEYLTDETIDRVCRRLVEGVAIEDVTRYAYGVAKLIYLEYLKLLEDERKMLKTLPPPPEPEPEPEPQSRIDCFRDCMNKLSDDDRDLIVRYYPEDSSKNIEERKKLAEEKGVQLNALRIRAHRIRKKLEKCIERCLKESSPPE
ncbi:MAG TPA: hypothetical protein VLR90_16685 [Blastocatellia bacterium]|nr:hypothetical protein [Blastocatellia bacterium]